MHEALSTLYARSGRSGQNLEVLGTRRTSVRGMLVCNLRGQTPYRTQPPAREVGSNAAKKFVLVSRTEGDDIAYLLCLALSITLTYTYVVLSI